MPAAPAPRTSAFGVVAYHRTRFVGRGYATEAVRGIAAFAFDALVARRVEIRCEPLNRPSARVAERAGFRLGGQLPNDAVGADGATRSTLVFAMTREVLAGG
jgi:RimJ/RimL family protein N-acetyltransferase